ncbi:putative ATP-binding cassette transporter [Rhodoligotrophos appendicifer]|uniref:ABC transporter ATP-binding protein/permease n=1 Tax=Rhodoligotrophos appendicifer TaxID=987056 RepID=UPI0014783ADB|nr:ABC transporter ATP-binding protein/permease [Rhodoligotrophos appendicifer]
MNVPTAQAPETIPDDHHSVARSLPIELFMLVQAFLRSPQLKSLIVIGVATVLVVGATAYGQVKLNAWNGPFYNALARKDLESFLHQLVVFGVIASALLVLNVAQAWLNRMTQLKLRQGLTGELLNQWLVPKRAFRLAGSTIGSNPDQRIQQDALNLTQLSANLGIGLLQSSLLLGSFVGVLWGLSEGVVIHFQGQNFSIPGYMVWCALFYAGLASWLSWLVGRRLIPLDAELYSREADFRFSVVHVSENSDAIALHGGEADEKRYILQVFDALLVTMRRIVFATTGLIWITSGYGWFTIVAPILVAMPAYFGGDLSFGELMVVVGAFNQVQQALRWFVDNFSTIADWRATLLRIASFNRALLAMDDLELGRSQISVTRDGGDRLIFEDLRLDTPTCCTTLGESRIEIHRGDRVLISGASGSGKTTLFRAIGGLWPWGSGHIRLPSDSVMFVPRHPYVPTGTLRSALAYPAQEASGADEELVKVLKKTSLGRFAGDLDRVARWDKEMSFDEQQCLAFARIYLQRPKWVIIDEAIDGVDDNGRRVIFSILKEDMADACIIYIGRGASQDEFFTRSLTLVVEKVAPSANLTDAAISLGETEPRHLPAAT